MECRKCSSFPCIREECNLYNGNCQYGKSLVQKVSQEMEDKYERSKICTNRVS